MFFIIISAVHVSGGFFHPSSGAYKTVCAALGIVMLSCCLPLVWMCWNTVPDDGSKTRPKHVERFDVFLTVHHSIKLVFITNLVHNCFIL
jgi:hypothetical protein